ncbi:DUF1822 family protein [Capilliphycus salinus ALCB114379]|uniref:DUF1822 family protein n=1 Tax=Capilliphycus salinus TaxID=2768948 RepID=UPI0039A694E2
MNYQTLTPLTFKVSLSLLAHSQAQNFSSYHGQTAKSKQVYLNTLAVYAVKFYLECLGFELDLEETLSEDPLMQALMDVADLDVKNYGKLECRPILENDPVCEIPPEVQCERIAYVFVRLNSGLSEAEIIGFVKELNSETLEVNQLQSLEEFTDYLQTIRQSKPVKSAVNLSEWLHNKLQNTILDGWQSVEALLGLDRALALGYRGANLRNKSTVDSPTSSSPQDSIRGAKLIDLGEGTGEPTVILLVAVTPETDAEMGIRVQIHPACGMNYLPENIKLSLLSETGEILREIPSRRLDNFIQLPYFRGLAGEQFTVKAAYKNNQITEDFII